MNKRSPRGEEAAVRDHKVLKGEQRWTERHPTDVRVSRGIREDSSAGRREEHREQRRAKRKKSEMKVLSQVGGG